VKRIKTPRQSVSVEVGSITIVAAVVIFIWCSCAYRVPQVTDVTVAGGIALLILTLVQGLIVMARRLTHCQDSLRETLQELAAVRCTERNRTARELHDSVCQLLAAARHSLELAAERRSVPDEFDTLFAWCHMTSNPGYSTSTVSPQPSNPSAVNSPDGPASAVI
jgi:signal transduction histidine kinase